MVKAFRADPEIWTDGIWRFYSVLCLLNCCWVGAMFPVHATSNGKESFGLCFFWTGFCNYKEHFKKGHSRHNLDVWWGNGGEKTPPLSWSSRSGNIIMLFAQVLVRVLLWVKVWPPFLPSFFSLSFIEVHRRCTGDTRLVVAMLILRPQSHVLCQAASKCLSQVGGLCFWARNFKKRDSCSFQVQPGPVCVLLRWCAEVRGGINELC